MAVFWLILANNHVSLRVKSCFPCVSKEGSIDDLLITSGFISFLAIKPEVGIFSVWFNPDLKNSIFKISMFHMTYMIWDQSETLLEAPRPCM